EERGAGTDTGGGGIMKPRATVPLEPEPAEKLTFIPAEAEEDLAPGAGLPPFLRNVVEEENDEELLDFFRRRREN
ncbi:MAG: hypothetical protein LBL37_09295, partial [Gracilibacteraceae bacterium]|nr:hypothetical protein [Gracilibacteraceae bacterium]